MKQNMQNSHTKAVLLLHRVSKCIQTLQNTDEVIKNGHSIATGSIGNTSRRQKKTKTQDNMCWTPLSKNKHNTHHRSHLQATRGKSEPNI